MWTFNKSTYQWNFTYEEKILLRVSDEEWVNFLKMHGGEDIQVDGITIPVPTYVSYLDEQDKYRQLSLKKVLLYMLKDKDEV